MVSMNQMWDAIADLGRGYLDRSLSKSPILEAENLCSTLLIRKGEASGTALAREVVQAFQEMSSEARLEFLTMLHKRFSADPELVTQAARAYLDEPSYQNRKALTKAAEPPLQELLRLINIAPEGTRSIVQMRDLLLKARKEHPKLSELDSDFKHLLKSWFNRGFLQFEQISWETPAAILEKLIHYESVHEIKGWNDLRRRLAEDRRCFSFFHPALPGEPLIFIEVALTKGIARKIQPLIEVASPVHQNENSDTAIFYSINNCQFGLQGISFGNFLIKQVVDALSQEFPKVKTYATLSPIPGFREWLERETAEWQGLVDDEARSLLSSPQEFDDESARAGLKAPLLRLCAHYLVNAKRKGQPVDPVERFHLRNGAEIESINWQGDLSATGIARSYGLMVNYHYKTNRIIANHEQFVNEGRINVSSQIRKLLA